MPSPESQRIRATLIKASEPDTRPIEILRREWEEAALQAPLPPETNVELFAANGVQGELVSCSITNPNALILFLHGGGFSTGSAKTHRELAAHLSLSSNVSVLLPDYRLAPEHPFPAAIEDAVWVYRWLLAQSKRPDQIVVGGDSAGGGLAMSTLLALRNEGLPLPAAGILISPWLDLALTGDSLETRAAVDPLTFKADLQYSANLYLAGGDPCAPLASPIYGDLHGLPPLLIHVGDHESLLSDSVRFTDRARAVGVEVQLKIWPEMWHVFHGWAATLPEAQAALDEIGAFVRHKLQ